MKLVLITKLKLMVENHMNQDIFIMIFGIMKMLLVESFIAALPKYTSVDDVFDLIVSLFWYQIYYLESRIQHVRRHFPNCRLCMDLTAQIQELETKWIFAYPKIITHHPLVRLCLDKHLIMMRQVFGTLKDTIKRIEKGGKWISFSGKTPYTYHRAEYLELSYRTISLNYLVGMLKEFKDLTVEPIELNKKRKRPKHFHITPTIVTIQSVNLTNPADNLYPVIDLFVDRIMVEINWCWKELGNNDKKDYIKAGLTLLNGIDLNEIHNGRLSKVGDVRILSEEEKIDIEERLVHITDFLIHILPNEKK